MKKNNDNFEYKYIVVNNSDLSKVNFEHYNKQIIFQKESIKNDEEFIEADIQEQTYEEEVIDHDLLDPINY